MVFRCCGTAAERVFILQSFLALMGGHASQEGVQCCDFLLPWFAVDAADSKSRHLSFLVFVNPADRRGEEKLLSVGFRGDSEAIPDLRVKDGHLPAFKIKTPAVLLGDVLDVNELGESWYNFVLGENENLGSCDWVEPFLDPAPNDREE